MTDAVSAPHGDPWFSVIIPAYQAAASIGRAVQSVLDQTCRAHEIIVVDDGSRDETADVVRGLGDRVRYLYQDNAGPSAARNHGAREATGNWLAFLDADDWYYPERLAVHREIIQAHAELDFVVGCYDYLDGADGRKSLSARQNALGRDLLRRHGENGRALIENGELGAFIVDQFSDTRGLSLPKEKFLRLGGFPEELRICEDVVFIIRLCAASHRAGVALQPLAAYLIHDQGLIRSDRLRAQRETVRALKTLSVEMKSAPDYIRRGWRQLLKDGYSNLAYRLSKSGKRSEAFFVMLQAMRMPLTGADLRNLLSVLKG